MDALRLDGNLQQLAAMVRGTNRRSGSVVPSDRPLPDVASGVPGSTALPESTRRIASGLSREEAEPLRDDADIEAYLERLSQEIGFDPFLAFAAQGGLSQGAVLALS